ncbi:Inorganic pyrophosphatase TTM2 [Sesamum angolense]|uniref:Inorganic pyrophosphatase TTM2 n=1 Tax=Sesamum angolense TaxID=2727404 RepID=A0AAE1WUF6_9LAMI|nr:Inorganic pyrophosphatase TTM2 [Sesamum angolense]
MGLPVGGVGSVLACGKSVIISMAKDTSNADLAHRKPVRACQLLAQKNDGLILIGVAGPSGAGKTAFTEKILNFMPSIGVISMDNYNDASRIIDGNFDDPRLTDYDTLLKNIQDLKAGKPVDVPVYDFKSSSRTGYRTLEVPSSRIVVIEGIYALSEKLRPFLDLRVSVTGCCAVYKAFIEPDLRTAHIKIINKFNPFTGFQSPTYILKSMRDVTVKQVKSIMSEEHAESTEQTYDIYLLPPGEDPETCQSYLRMRNKDGKYNLMFERAASWWTNALGYTIAAILKRSSHVFSDERVCVKIDWLEQLNRHYVQALPDDLKTKLSIDEDSVSSPKEALSRASAERAARIKNLRSGMSHSYSTNRDKNLSKNRRFEDRTADSSATLANQGAVAHLSEQISTLNDRMDDFTSRIEELNSKLTSTKSSPSSQNIALQAETYNGSAPTSYFISGLGNGSLTGPMMPNSSSSSQLAKESSLFDELSSVARGQRQVMHQLDNLSNLLREKLGERSERDKRHNTNVTPENDLTRVSIILASLAVGSLGIFWFKGLLSRN